VGYPAELLGGPVRLKCAAYVPDGIDMGEPKSMAGLPQSGKTRRGARASGRGYERRTFPFRVRIISHAAPRKKCEEGWCIDISETGVAFMTEADLDLTDVFELVFELKGQPALRRYARLLYRCGPRYGASFTNFD
jgi:PilZ domain